MEYLQWEQDSNLNNVKISISGDYSRGIAAWDGVHNSSNLSINTNGLNSFDLDNETNFKKWFNYCSCGCHNKIFSYYGHNYSYN